MIDNQVQNNLHSACVHLLQQLIEILHTSELFHDGLIVRDVIPVIIIGRLEDRTDPNHIDSEVVQIIKLGNDSLKITNTISIAVHETPRVNLICCRFFPPSSFHSSSLNL
ncbi:hypothetical protein D3C81_1006850 [compost metagenome]